MATVSNEGVSLHYRVTGRGAPTDHPVVFANEAGLGGWSWGWQHAALAGQFETTVWDLRGTGRSDAPQGPYDLATLVDDFEAVCRAVDARGVHAVGAGLGGAIALEAARCTSRIETLTLFGTAARGSALGLGPLVAPPGNPETIRSSLGAAVSSQFLDAHPEAVDGIVDWRAAGDASPVGARAQLAALDDFDVTGELVEITQPTLVVHGTDDELVPNDAGRELADGLPRGSFLPVEGAGHLAFVERSKTVNDRLVAFLEANDTEAADGG